MFFSFIHHQKCSVLPKVVIFVFLIAVVPGIKIQLTADSPELTVNFLEEPICKILISKEA